MAYGLPYGMASRDVVLCFCLTALLYSTFGQTVPKSELEPEFLAPLENHTVSQGRDVSFTCVVNHLQSYKVAWIKSDSRAILAVHTHMVAHNSRLSVTHNGHNTWKLHVTNVQPNDSGTYMCQVNTDPMRSQTGYMKVVIPPDIMDLDDSADLLTAAENSDLRLKCQATGTPRPVVTWRREDGRNITLRNLQGVIRGTQTAVKSFEGEQLHLIGILRQEMGSYLCIASNGVPPTVSKRYYVNVRFKPLIKVSKELVGAPANSNVVLQCYVESSPKALNTWYRDGGVKLLADEKHELSETTINDYAYQLNLTIKRLSKADFGSYTCTGENAYGRAEGTIRLQEMHVSRPTVPSTRNSAEASNVEKQWRKQQNERKSKKHSYSLDRERTEMTSRSVASGGGSFGHPTTPMSRRNISNVLPNVVNAKNTKASSYPQPAPAPAHSAPTQLDAQSVGCRSFEDFQLVRIGLPMVLVLAQTRI